MTTATKERTKTRTKTREQELEETVAHLNGQLGKLNEELAAYEQHIVDGQQRIAELINGSFDKPLEGFAEDVDAARRHVADGQARADIARQRVEAFMHQTKLEQLRVELTQLKTEREVAEARAAAEAHLAQWLKDFYVRCELLSELRDMAEEQFDHGRRRISDIQELVRRFGLQTPAGFDQQLYDIANRKERRELEVPASREPLRQFIDGIVLERIKEVRK